MSIAVSTDWWARPDLAFQKDNLIFAGRGVNEMASQFGTPTFVYSGKRIIDNASRLHDALSNAGFADRFRIYFAMKANRFAPLLTHLKSSGMLGIDACSPNEVEHAISCGFREDEISFTAGSLSNRDYQKLGRFPGIRVNCDSLSTIRRLGELRAGTAIGIRVNPAIGVGRAENDKLHYAGHQTTKFGIYREQFDQALDLAGKFDLTIETIHFHTGCGYLTPQLDRWDEIIQRARWFIEQVPSLQTINVGGGLGVPHVNSDQPLDLAHWSGVLANHFLDSNLTIEVEPGDYLVKDSGLLLLSVTTVEQKQSTTFVGLDAGFNLAVEPAVYGLPFEPVPAVRNAGQSQTVTVHGNINEALDIWYRDIELPPLNEGDIVALINAGAYSSSMASNHCMRGEFKEMLLL